MSRSDAIIAASNLQGYGSLLDGMDSGRTPMLAKEYRKAALYAAKVMGEFGSQPFVRDLCATSPALKDIWNNLKDEDAVTAADNGFNAYTAAQDILGRFARA